MTKRLVDRLSYANVVSTLCLFLILGMGGAYAAKNLAKNSVGSKQIKDGQVKSVDVADNGITGTDINEGSLGKVPSATNADSATSAANADKLDNKDSTAFPVEGLGSVHHGDVEQLSEAVNCRIATGVSYAQRVQRRRLLPRPRRPRAPAGIRLRGPTAPTIAGTSCAQRAEDKSDHRPCRPGTVPLGGRCSRQQRHLGAFARVDVDTTGVAMLRAFRLHRRSRLGRCRVLGVARRHHLPLRTFRQQRMSVGQHPYLRIRRG